MAPYDFAAKLITPEPKKEKTQDDYEAEGFTCLHHSDDILDILTKFETMLEPFGLKIQYSDDETLGYLPLRLGKKLEE